MADREIFQLIKREQARQKRVVNLIASENYVSKDVLVALGSELTNKYAEGYPGRRYYGGNEVVDLLETLVKQRALKLFKLVERVPAGGWAVNVQALSGSPANLAVYSALVPLGDKIMAMSLNHGGHLTHGHQASLTGKLWHFVHYGVDRDSETLDYEALQQLALKEKPRLIVAGYTAYPRVIDFKKFRGIADSVGAYLMVDMSHFAGLVAGGVYPSPFTYADVVTTTTHKTLRGPRAALIFSRQVAARPFSFLAPSDPAGGGVASRGETKTASPAPRLIPELIDRAVFPGLQGGPHLNQLAAVGVALREASAPAFKTYAKRVVANAQVLAAELGRRGWRLVAGGTDSHLLLVDVWQDGRGLGGQAASEALERAGIIVNKNTIPFDTRSPRDPSGLRLGTAAETTRGATVATMRRLAAKIDQVLRQELKRLRMEK